MPLRTPNNPNTSKVIMGVLKNILPVDTQLALTSTSGTGLELIYIQEKYKMALNMTEAIPIAVNMSAGEQDRMHEAQNAFAGTTSIEVGYYSRWDSQNETIDAIWAALDDDLERMAANIEGNDNTEYGGTNHTMGLEKIMFSPYEGEFDQTFPGLTLVKRTMTLTYNILPYGA